MKNVTIKCWTSGRRAAEYEVTFDKEGLVVQVVKCVKDIRKPRKTYHYTQKEPMGLTAACAVRAARKQHVTRLNQQKTMEEK